MIRSLIILSASLPFVAMTFNGRCVAQEPIQESQSEPLEWHQVFEKADSWSATMLHCRNRFKSFLATGPIDKAFPAVDLTLRRIRVADPDFGVYEERVMRDWSELPLPGVTDSESRPTTALDWFRSTDTTIDRALIGMVLSRTESECEIAKRATSPLRMRLAALQNEDASANDPRWLELYCDATDTEMLLTPLQGLDTFQDSAKTIREAFGAKCTFTCNEVQEKQEKMDARWNVLFDRATVSPTKLTALLDEYATLRNEVRFGITSVRRAMSDSELVNLQTEWEEQLKDLENELRRRDWYAREAVIRQTLHPAALVFPEDRDSVDIAVRRCRALLDDLQRSAAIKSEEWEEENAILAPLEELAKTISTRQRDARHALFFETCRLRRRIAFRNPLLDFDRVLFVKRHFLRWGNGPAQKQYYGYRAHGGGAICVLERPFSNQAAVTNLLANSVCERGRLKGERLEKGDYVSPELSFDGQTILFAYTENSTAGSAAQFVDVPRTPQNTYHIFRVHSDGTGLAQLTDGPYNDVDPCFLPNGRITFISERRGGCGRSAADRNYTLHAMADDGNDMVRISHHETNEWQPSIGHDGRILYTRWDIWDRGYFQAMNVWSSYPNGSDGRALFGNYFEGNDPCPNATMDVRPVPGSHQLIGTASSYFEQSYGALVVIDPHRPDDAKMTKLKRFTPEQPFAWREMSRYTGPLDFGTPWPLSEFFCLCVHDADSAIRRGPENNYGIYLVDAFGNKVLLYRDPQISCLSPIPLRPRPRPPIVTRQQSEYVTAGTLTPTRELNDSSLATVGLANVYQSYHPVPEDLRIKRLRIIQVAYKRVIGRNIPVMGYGEDTGHDKGGRMVLGTVPVEDDGSAHFQMPAGVPVYFQAIGADGLAVQTMRSLTYAQPGEQLFCQGCHEPQQSASVVATAMPKAFHRAPSPIEPDVSGSHPLTFPRLVQPVLDRHCIACHGRDANEPPSLVRGTRWQKYGTRYYDEARDRVVDSIPVERWGEEGHKYIWYDSYVNLYPYVREACFVKHGPQEGARTKPGTFGARASRLYRLLKEGHHDVKLNAEELHRFALWIDTNCRFFGPTRDLLSQAMGQTVMPELE